jgi:phosphatidylglycerol:prolipoprotein diacylglycerol transferase
MILNQIQIGSLTLHLYGLILGVGILVGGTISANIAKANNVSKETFWDSLVWAIVGGVIGARIYHVIDLWSYYQKNLDLIFKIWTGGLGIFGGIIGGAISLYLFTKYKHTNTSFSKFIDLTSFGLPIGQAIGRFGNFVNQELYGYPTNVPWAILIDPSHRLPGYENFSRFHPLFAYEAAWNCLVFLALFKVLKSKKWPIGKGNYFALYLILYSLGRAFIENFKINPWTIFNIPTASLISAATIFGSLIYLKRKNLQ